MSLSVWDLISQERKEPEGVLTDRFIMRFDRFLNWDLLSANYDFSLEMLRTYQHRVNWCSILKRFKFTESFLREMAPNFEDCWELVCKYQVLTESFIRDYASKFDYELVLLYQDVSGKFVQSVYHSQPLFTITV